MKITETCRCGGNFSVEADGDTAARYIDKQVTAWRDAHLCVPAASDDKRTGVGFAATQQASAPHPVWGHSRSEVRA